MTQFAAFVTILSVDTIIFVICCFISVSIWIKQIGSKSHSNFSAEIPLD